MCFHWQAHEISQTVEEKASQTVEFINWMPNRLCAHSIKNQFAELSPSGPKKYNKSFWLDSIIPTVKKNQLYFQEMLTMYVNQQKGLIE